MILILNCGSQSIKWKLFNYEPASISENKREIFNLKEYQKILNEELSKFRNVEIRFIGHRVVHGGKHFRPQIITKKVFSEIKKFSKVAPLHNPFALLGIKACQKKFKTVKQIAVFDTGFFADLPEKTKIYPLAESLIKKYQIKRYGFHGISHKYLAEKTAELLNKPLKKINLITFHIGGGTSITAIKKGKPIDTSMGFTPMEGLMMTTRPGDLDSGILFYLLNYINKDKLYQQLNFESGIKGLCGSSDIRDLLKRKDKKTKIALNCFVYRIQKYLSAYFGILNEVDAIVFGGAAGFGSAKLRKMIVKNLKFLKNTEILKINTDEELAIAKEVSKFVKKS